MRRRGTPEVPIGPLELLDSSTSTEPRDACSTRRCWPSSGHRTAPRSRPWRCASDAAPPVASRGRVAGQPDAATASAGRTAARLVVADRDDGTVLVDRPVQLSNTFINQVLPFFDQYALSHRTLVA